jgi:hypothetical protein
MLNKTMTFMLRSPLHRFVSKSLLLITFTGCKSGKVYTTPVSYSQEDHQVRIFTHARWWKNLCGGAPVSLRLRGKTVTGNAETIDEDKRAVADGLAAHLRQVPFDAKFYNVTFDERGCPKADEVEKAAQAVVMVRVTLD